MPHLETGTSARVDLPVAVVIGAGGMGIAAARRLGQHYRLLVTDIDASKLDKSLAALRYEGHDATVLACDVTDPGSVAGLAEAVKARGSLRVLAHVAGLSPSMADWKTILRVNLIGVHNVAAALLPLAGQGTAGIFISSLAAHGSPPGDDIVALLDEPLGGDFLDRLEALLGSAPSTNQAYAFSKLAINRFCQRRAAAWGRRGARIISLSPGLIATPMGALEFQRQPMKYELLAKTPIQREGTMLEIADAIEFLVSDKASFISGVDLLVDGGIAAALKYPET